LDQIQDAMIGIYRDRTQLSEGKIRELLTGPDGDGVWLTAPEAMALNLADQIGLGDEEEYDPDDIEDGDAEPLVRASLQMAKDSFGKLLGFYGSLPECLAD
jgi:hypothetical protein